MKAMPDGARCGTAPGYQIHRRRKQVPCRACCTAHAAYMAEWRAGLTKPVTGPDEPIRYALARAGREPAEALTGRDRWRLVAELHRAGLSDVEVAAWTRMTTYTAARIRGDMALSWVAPSSSTARRAA